MNASSSRAVFTSSGSAEPGTPRYAFPLAVKDAEMVLKQTVGAGALAMQEPLKCTKRGVQPSLVPLPSPPPLTARKPRSSPCFSTFSADSHTHIFLFVKYNTSISPLLHQIIYLEPWRNGSALVFGTLPVTPKVEGSVSLLQYIARVRIRILTILTEPLGLRSDLV